MQSTDDSTRLQGTQRGGLLLTVTGHVLLITPSLQEALSDTGYLWIDQLCINQRDLTRRGRQVEIMHEIYAGGCRTLVWLGLSNEASMTLHVALRAIG